MNIKITMSPSKQKFTETLSLEELGLTKKEWKEKTVEEKIEYLNDYYEDLDLYWSNELFEEE